MLAVFTSFQPDPVLPIGLSSLAPLRVVEAWLSGTSCVKGRHRGAPNMPCCVIQMGMSENGVYPQWNSHLVGIMIMNHWVQGYTIFRQTQMDWFHGKSQGKPMVFLHAFTPSNWLGGPVNVPPKTSLMRDGFKWNEDGEIFFWLVFFRRV